jgi:DNA-binding GntR family transcriptional regulator
MKFNMPSNPELQLPAHIIDATVNFLHVPTHKQAAYETLRDMIVELDLPPGLRLVEMELARRLRVSKTPIREALALLEIDGLIEFAPYRGASVSWLSVVEMEEQGFLVDTLEVPALPRVVARITDDELVAAGRVVRQLQQARKSRNGRRYRRLTSEYHRVLFAPTGYPRLVRFIETLVFPAGLRYDRVFCDNFPPIWDEHLKLLVARFEAIKARDAAAAAAAVQSHRVQLGKLCRSHLSDPVVRPYFAPA